MENKVSDTECGEGGYSSDVELGDEAEEVDTSMNWTSAEVPDTMTARVKECASRFERLEEAVDR